MGLQETLDWYGFRPIEGRTDNNEHSLQHVLDEYGSDLKDKIDIPVQSLHYASGQYHYAFGGVHVDTSLLEGNVCRVEDVKGLPSSGKKEAAFLKIPKKHEPWRDWAPQVAHILQQQNAYLGKWMLPTGVILLPEDEYLIVQKSVHAPRALTVEELITDESLRKEFAEILAANKKMMKEQGMGYDLMGAQSFGAWVSYHLESMERYYKRLVGHHVDIFETTWTNAIGPLLFFIRKKFADKWDFVYEEYTPNTSERGFWPKFENILVVETQDNHTGDMKKTLCIQDLALMFGVTPGINNHLPTVWKHAWSHDVLRTTHHDIRSAIKWVLRAKEDWSKREIIARLSARYEQFSGENLLQTLSRNGGETYVATTVQRSKGKWQKKDQ